MLEKSFYNKENPKLTDELTEEMAGIFNWSLDGLLRLRARGRFQPPTTSKEAIQALEDLASPVGAFMRECCKLGAKETVEAAVMYLNYRRWCDEHGQKAVNQQLLGRDLRAVRPEVRVRRLGPERRRTYVGIGLGTTDEVSASQCEIHRESREPSTADPDDSRDSTGNQHCSTRICAHCSKAETEGSPLLTVSVNGIGAEVHHECMATWRAAL
jgi:putative DNA primase/helicase